MHHYGKWQTYFLPRLSDSNDRLRSSFATSPPQCPDSNYFFRQPGLDYWSPLLQTKLDVTGSIFDWSLFGPFRCYFVLLAFITPVKYATTAVNRSAVAIGTAGPLFRILVSSTLHTRQESDSVSNFAGTSRLASCALCCASYIYALAPQVSPGYAFG